MTNLECKSKAEFTDSRNEHYIFYNLVMKSIFENPKYAAITGFLLAIPFITLFLLITFGIEPRLGPLDNSLNPENSHFGSFFWVKIEIEHIFGYLGGKHDLYSIPNPLRQHAL